MELALRLLRNFLLGALVGYIIGNLLYGCEAHAQQVTVYEATELAGHAHGVEPRLLRAIIHVESGGNALAVGGVGEVGLMQLNPRSFKQVSFNVMSNVDTGARYLAILQLKCPFKKNYTYVVCYNKGLHPRDSMPTRTHYYTAVMEAYNHEQ
jgi:hypothetical protein